MSTRPAVASRETIVALECYWGLVRHWNRKINLISGTSTAEGWRRHIEDSIQLALHFPDRPVLHCDLGSGGGLPAIPVTLGRRDTGHDDAVVMIEADARKAAFLRTACRTLGLSACIVAERLERAPPSGADVVTARALAPLDRLLGQVARHLAPTGIAILPKGRGAEAEVEAARRRWTFDVDRLPSRTADDAAVLRISNIGRLG